MSSGLEQHLVYGVGDVFGGESEVLEQHPSWGALAIGVDADHSR